MADKSASIEESVLKTALQLLQDGKFRTTSVTAICRQAGVSRSSFYRCFINKEEVLRRLLQLEFSSLCTIEDIDEIEDGQDPPCDPPCPEVLCRILARKTDGQQTDMHCADRQYAKLQDADKTSTLQAWFQTLLSHAPVLNLFYTNGYAELARAQIIALYAGPPADTETYYQRVFEVGGVLSLYEACR